LTGVSRDRWPLILGVWSVPVSIALAEFFLSVAALVQLVRLLRRQVRVNLPTCFWFWLAWAVLELLMWSLSPDPEAGSSEIRHLLLLGLVILAVSAFEHPKELLVAWKGVFVSATISSVYLIAQFFYRLHIYQQEIAAGGDTNFYLRSGGLLHHWMVYGTVETLVVAGLIAFWSFDPEARRRWWPIAAVNGVAIILSLTRMTWVTSLLLVGIALLWKRSRWILALPMVLLVLYASAPEAVRARAANFIDPVYYSNAERLQMITVGWRMVREFPLTGVGPGRVEHVYESFLKPGEPVPAYHGHLHNNFAQIAAQFGIPATLAALLFVFQAFRDLLAAKRKPMGRDLRFVTDTAILALIGFLFAGLFEYTYGHSLGLIMVAFAVFPALSIRVTRTGC
jgi:O-antigen ligase